MFSNYFFFFCLCIWPALFRLIAIRLCFTFFYCLHNYSLRGVKTALGRQRQQRYICKIFLRCIFSIVSKGACNNIILPKKGQKLETPHEFQSAQTILDRRRTQPFFSVFPHESLIEFHVGQKKIIH